MNDNKILDKGGFNNDEPIQRMVWQKNEKLKESQYELTAQRIELLVYLDAMFTWPYWQKTIPQFLERGKNYWYFDRIWIFRYDTVNPKILWSYSKAKESVKEYVIL